MSLKAIVAVDRSGAIGHKGKLLWHLPEDLKLFKKKTEGGVVVMGRKTLDSLPFKDGLPNRVNICLTRNPPEKRSERVLYCSDYKKVIEIAKTKEVWVIGGAEIYVIFRDHYDEVHLTDVEANNEYADTKLPQGFTFMREPCKIVEATNVSSDEVNANVLVFKPE
jgi:dihydrofolate reductase